MLLRFSTPLRQGAALLALTLGSAAFGQAANYPQGAIVQSLEPGPGDDLSRYLSELNASPRSLTALLGAARAALELGDAQGALSFLGRAEQVAPRDGRVKAAMGAAFVASENSQAAFKLFAEAQSLGIQPADFARDRGLAYDMIGDPVRAQADYTLALRKGSDPEVERRMALSRAIAGDKAGALAVLEPQIRQQDRAAWRTRAFVLALTGDAAGAASVAQTMMPGGQSAGLRPFFDKLPQLNAADKAMAVHFGRFPSDGRPVSYAAATVPSAAYAPPPVRQQAVSEPIPRPSYGPSYRGVARPQEAVTSPTVQSKAVQPVTLTPSVISDEAEVVPTPPARQAAVPTPAPVKLKPDAPRLQFADVVSAVQSLPGAVEDAPRPAPVAKKPAPAKVADKKPAVAKVAEKKPEPKPVAKKAEPAKAKEPQRIWVQLAAGQNKGVFPAEYKKMQGKAAKLLTGKTAWTAPLGNSNRLLVGPFKTDKEARDLVNELAKLKLGSYPWKSEDGEKVEKLAAK